MIDRRVHMDTDTPNSLTWEKDQTEQTISDKSKQEWIHDQRDTLSADPTRIDERKNVSVDADAYAMLVLTKQTEQNISDKSNQV